MSVQEAFQAYQAGNLVEARRLVEETLSTDPNNEQAWSLKILVAEHEFEREAAAQRTLLLNPENEIALNYQQQKAAAPQSASEAAPDSTSPAKGGVIQGTLPDLGTSPESTTAPETSKETSDEPAPDTFEMLWDCEFCGTQKLLGYTHKFCPHCGAQQNPNKRYFPSDDEKVAVKNHVYYGVDIVCQTCNSLNSAKSEFCTNCGSPLTEAGRAAQLESEVREAGDKFAGGKARDLVKEKFEAEQARLTGLSAKPSKKGEKSGFSLKRTGIIGSVITFVIACCAGIVALLFWTNESSVVVAGHSWEREIKIEEFQAVNDGDWCDSMPGGAYSVSRSERERSSRQVPDGEECRTRRVDNGDGTFSERQECTTKYRSEPIYDDYCEYTIDRWDYERSVYARGDSFSDAPTWPQLSLASGSGLGAEREGDREQIYIVQLRDSENDKTYECEFEDENRWREFSPESKWILEVGAIAGEPRCDSLTPAN